MTTLEKIEKILSREPGVTILERQEQVNLPCCSEWAHFVDLRVAPAQAAPTPFQVKVVKSVADKFESGKSDRRSDAW